MPLRIVLLKRKSVMFESQACGGSQSLTEVSGRDISSCIKAVERLDLGPIMFKLVMDEEGPKWSVAQAQAAERWYRRFLILNLKYPNNVVVPNKIIDQFWHQHILDTRKYAQDCEGIFGGLLHHFPYFGIRDEEDARNLGQAFQQTKDLFLVEFGESLSALNLFFTPDTLRSGACMGTECGGTACGDTNKIELRSSVRPTLNLVSS